MTKATSSIQKGIDYQARWFWKWAAALLWPDSNIRRVSIEKGPKGLDDVGIEHVSAVLDGRGDPRDIERHQVKFRVRLDAQMKADDLIDPAAIGGTEFSFLERARDAYEADTAAGRLCQVVFVTDRYPLPTDVLGKELYDAGSDLLDVDRLMGPGKGPVADVRKRWQARIERSGDEFVSLMRALRLDLSRGSMRGLDEQLDSNFRVAGMRPIETGRRVREYDDLARKLVAEGRTTFDAATLRAVLTQEGLLVPPATPMARRVGVRSFLRFAEDLPSQMDSLFDAVPLFEHRQIRDPGLWGSVVVPELETLVAAEVAISGGKPIELHLSCSMSLAVAIGYLVDHRAGVPVGVMQSGSTGRSVWSVGSASEAPDLSITPIEGDGPDGAIVLSIARDIRTEALGHIRAGMPSVGHVITISALPPSNDLLHDGKEAQRVANATLEAVSQLRENGATRTHILAAAPNTVLFMIGRGLRGRGPVSIWEYDLNAEDGRSTYSLGIALPITAA